MEGSLIKGALSSELPLRISGSYSHGGNLGANREHVRTIPLKRQGSCGVYTPTPVSHLARKGALILQISGPLCTQ